MNLRNFFFSISLVITTVVTSNAQYAEVYPTNWWVNMKMSTVQLLLKSPNADFSKETISIDYPGIKLIKQHTFENGKYVALDIQVSTKAKPGTVAISCMNGNAKNIIEWPLLERRATATELLLHRE